MEKLFAEELKTLCSELGIVSRPETVQNYQKKVEKLYATLKHNSDLAQCMLLTLISEDVSLNIPKKPKKLNCFFVTINARQDADFSKLKSCIDKGLTKTWIESGVYCYEQRSEDPLKYSGYHCHILLTSNKKKYKADIINEWFSTCKKITTKNAVNVKYVKKELDYDAVYNYILGNKKDPNKMAKHLVDLKFREHFKLASHYVVG